MVGCGYSGFAPPLPTSFPFYNILSPDWQINVLPRSLLRSGRHSGETTTESFPAHRVDKRKSSIQLFQSCRLHFNGCWRRLHVKYKPSICSCTAPTTPVDTLEFTAELVNSINCLSPRPLWSPHQDGRHGLFGGGHQNPLSHDGVHYNDGMHLHRCTNPVLCARRYGRKARGRRLVYWSSNGTLSSPEDL
jgi:hypothetical protein